MYIVGAFNGRFDAVLWSYKSIINIFVVKYNMQSNTNMSSFLTEFSALCYLRFFILRENLILQFHCCVSDHKNIKL